MNKAWGLNSEIHSFHVAISSSRTIWSIAFFPSPKDLGTLVRNYDDRYQFISGSPLCAPSVSVVKTTENIVFWFQEVLKWGTVALHCSSWKKISLACLFRIAFSLFGVSHISILSFQFSWPISRWGHLQFWEGSYADAGERGTSILTMLSFHP